MNIRSWLKNKTIGVLYGGWSPEREISIRSGKAVMSALERLGFNPVGIDVDRNIINRLKDSKISIAFIALHGPFGEDGKIQSILEFLDIPYTGSDVLASALAMDKIYSKKIFEWHKLSTPLSAAKFQKFPVVVKPSNQGSTIGVSIVRNKNKLKPAIDLALKYSSEIIMEEYIPGKELAVGILGKEALPIIEIVPENNFYDYSAKYVPGKSKHIVPAKISKELSLSIQKLAKKAFDALGCKAVGRVDMRFSGNKKAYLLEVNTIPGLTETSLLPEAAQVIGLNFEELVLKIIEYSLEHADLL